MRVIISLAKLPNGTSRATFAINGSEETTVIATSHAQAIDRVFSLIRKKLLRNPIEHESPEISQ